MIINALSANMYLKCFKVCQLNQLSNAPNVIQPSIACLVQAPEWYLKELAFMKLTIKSHLLPQNQAKGIHLINQNKAKENHARN